MEELKLAATERGLTAIRKRRSGPVMVMESRTGKLVGTFTSLEEALTVVLLIAPIPKNHPLETVGWHSDVEYFEIPRRCPNGHGPSCLCLDSSAIYLCAAPPCRFRAECGGACRVHYSQLKVLGDLTELAIAKTAAMAESGEFDLQNLPSYARITSLKIPSPTDKCQSSFTPGEIMEITSGVIGMTIRWTGTEFLLMDKDANILDRVSSKLEFFEEEIVEEAPPPVISRRGKKNPDAE